MSKPGMPTDQREQATSTLARPLTELATRFLLFGLLGLAAFALLNYTVRVWRPFCIAFAVAYLLSLTLLIITLSALTVSWQTALTAFVLLIILDQLDGNLLGPVLLSNAVKMHPVVVLLAVLAGGTLFGVWGVVLAVPAAAFLQVLYCDLYKTSRFYRRSSREVERQDAA